MNRRIIFSLLILILLSASAGSCGSAGSSGPGGTSSPGGRGATYYVKAGGNDSLDGLSDANAWARISKVQATVTSGDTVYFRSQDTWTATGASPLLTPKAGVTYDGSTYGSGTRAKFTTAYTGAGQCLIRIIGSNVTITGIECDMNAKRVHGIYIGDAGYTSDDIYNTVIDNCVIHNSSGQSGDWGYGILVTSGPGYVTYNTTIKNCEIYNTFHEGIAVYANWGYYNCKSDGTLIRNCYIHDTGNAGVGAGSGVDINNNSANVTVEFCYLCNNSAHGVGFRVSPPNEGAGNILAGPTNTTTLSYS
jgi:hypothetical protein